MPPPRKEGERKYKISRREEGILKMIWSGSVYFGRRLAWMHGNEALRACPFCKEDKEEDYDHMWWECPAWKNERKYVESLTTKEERGSWPSCTRCCGIWVGDLRKQQDDAQRSLMELVKESEEGEAPSPPFTLRVPVGSEYYEDGKLQVAGDGACPHQDTLDEFRRSAFGLYYGPNHPANCGGKVLDPVQGAQSAEVAAVTRWAQWAWSPTTFLTDSQ